MRSGTRLKSGFAAAIAGLWLCLIPACSGDSGGDATPPPVPRDPVVVLREQAERLWAARQANDWATVYQFQDFSHLPEPVTQADFVNWCENQAPFRHGQYTLGEVAIDRDMAWVEVTAETLMRRFPKLAPREVHRWEKWRRVDQRWLPVPPEAIENYPAAPADRDLAEEERLRERFMESWAARQAQDWDLLYELCDPRDRPERIEGSRPLYLPLKFLSQELLWTEVIGDQGNVRVIFVHKIDDPSLSKLEPKKLVMTEPWVKHEDQWYIDLSRAIK